MGRGQTVNRQTRSPDRFSIHVRRYSRIGTFGLFRQRKKAPRESTSFWKLTAWKVSPSLRLLTHRGCSYLEEIIIYSFISRSKNPRSRPIIRCLIRSLFPAVPPAGFLRQADFYQSLRHTTHSLVFLDFLARSRNFSYPLSQRSLEFYFLDFV